jgi:L-arabinose isomerase
MVFFHAQSLQYIGSGALAQPVEYVNLLNWKFELPQSLAVERLLNHTEKKKKIARTLNRALAKFFKIVFLMNFSRMHVLRGGLAI